MSSLDKIKQPVRLEMEEFEGRFRSSMRSEVALLDKITHYIVKRKGKQMRPMFVFLTAKMLSDTNDQTYRAATLIELLHTATLVHDDVVDDASKRRGFFSINALWKNKVAVLVGDYLLSRGLLLAVKHKDFHLLEITSNAVREMSEGELLQMEKARKLDITEEVYFNIIRQKTASLIASCCASGAASVSEDKEVIEQMRLFGETVGIAFQIRDDLFDYGSDANIGKPTGIDIKEKKMTLPLIYALNNSDRSEKRFIINTIKNHNTDEKRVAQVIAMVRDKGGIEYTVKCMKEYQQKALAMLESYPNNEARKSLVDLVNFVIDRTK
ncbi:MAG: polyprenyl synthetase family protein [Flavobacteriales bacterium]|nr:polyprenyl synthetase family protein [Flavobacteriales bacterium]